MASQDIFDQIPDIQSQQPVMPPMSNRRRAMAQKQQQQDPFAAIEIPPAVQAQMGRPVQTPTAQPKASRPVTAQSAAAPIPQNSIESKQPTLRSEPEIEDLKTPSPGIGQRIRTFFEDRNARQIYKAAIAWISTHEMWFIFVAVLLIAVGLLVSRYISFVGAIVLLALGWLVNRDNDVDDTFMLYICALACFIIPYLF